MDGKSLDIAEERLNKLKEILPDAFTEGKIDWEKLQATLGEDIEFKNERYVLNWAGKSDAFRVLQSPTTATLVPCEEESVDFDDTENIFIEGENLEVLKVLQKSYFGKIKMIYIDPPYNTGNDSFIYPDKFSETKEEYLSRIGDKDETGYMTREGLYRKNSKDSGHYHSNWLSMMYPRLFMARNLLREDGVIFVSIDDNEVHNLRLFMSEIFGEEHFVAQFPWRKRTAKSDVPFGVSQDYEWLLCFAKSSSFVAGIEGVKRKYYESPDLPNMPWRIHDMTTQRTALERPNSNFTMINPKTGDKYPVNPNAVWRVTSDTFKQFYSENRIVFPGDYDFLNISKPVLRYFKDDDETKAGERFGFTPVSTNLPKEAGMTQDGTKDIGILFETKIFGFPKPVGLLQHLIKFTTSIDKSATILDFFSGSGTTAHATLRLNKEDGGNRKFIMVQFPEKCDEKSDAFKAGYENIAEIGKERIRRVIKKIKEDKQTKLDVNGATGKQDLGFKVFKLQESNFKIWRSDVKTEGELYTQLTLHTDPVDENAKIENILYELLLKSGIPLTARIEEKDGYYLVNESEIALILKKIDEGIIKTVISEKPKKVITLDRLFEDNDQLKTNTALQMKDSEIDFRVV